MTTPLRRGACPTLQSPMQTGDGLLVRMGFSGGLCADQLTALARSAQAHGAGQFEITARGNLQARGFSPQGAQQFAQDLAAASLPFRAHPQVETAPLAGCDPHERSNSLALSSTIASVIASAEFTDRLSPKLAIVVDGGGQFTLDALNADIRFNATVSGRWRLSTGGDGRSARILGELDEANAAATTTALLRAIALQGPAARARDLPDETIQGLRRTLDPAQADPPRVNALVAAFEFHLAGQRFARGMVPPFGAIDALTLISLIERSRQQDVCEFRFTPGRMLLALTPTVEQGAAVVNIARSLDLIVEPDDARLFARACAGLPGCASGHLETRVLARRLAASQRFTKEFPLHVSGCAKQCAVRQSAGLTLIGEPTGVAPIVNGRSLDRIETRDLCAIEMCALSIAGERAIASRRPAP